MWAETPEVPAADRRLHQGQAAVESHFDWCPAQDEEAAAGPAKVEVVVSGAGVGLVALRLVL
jgi:hypothetical protein